MRRTDRLVASAPMAPITRAELTYREVRLAAQWLRTQAAQTGLREAEAQRARLAARARVARQKRTADGRWTR